MKLLSVDLELNQPSGKVIQVGACVMELKTGKITDQLSIFVNPKEDINPEITKLTGISQADVDQHGYSVKEAYFLLKKFAQKNKTFKNPLVWGSGVWSDSSHLYKEADPGETNFMGHRVIDVKTIYQSLRLRSWQKTKGGLENSMKEMGLSFEGKSHNALCDAINTARFWFFLTENLKTVGPKIRSPRDL